MIGQMMQHLFDLLGRSGPLWTGWALVLVVVLYLTLVAYAFAATKMLGERPWFSVSPLFMSLFGMGTMALLAFQSEDIANILRRLAQFHGDADRLVQAHSMAFVAIVLVMTARAFFVISEMDNGRYAGDDRLPMAIAQSSPMIRWGEVVVRFFIIATLIGFSSAFIQVELPTSTASASLIGRPTILADLHQRCAEYRSVLDRIGHGVDASQCLAGHLSGLDPRELNALASKLMRPIPYLLVPYLAMLIWSVCLVCHAADKDPNGSSITKRLLWHQSLSAVLAILNILIMCAWVEISTAGQVSLANDVSRKSAEVWLIVLSLVGLVLSIVMLVVLTRRFFTDVRGVLIGIRSTWASFAGTRPHAHS